MLYMAILVFSFCFVYSDACQATDGVLTCRILTLSHLVLLSEPIHPRVIVAIVYEEAGKFHIYFLFTYIKYTASVRWQNPVQFIIIMF